MRSFIVIVMFVASLAQAGWSEYEEVRDLDLDASGVSQLSIIAGAGSMDVTGIEGLDKITVKATIVVPDEDEEDAIKIANGRWPEKRFSTVLRSGNCTGKMAQRSSKFLTQCQGSRGPSFCRLN